MDSVSASGGNMGAQVGMVREAMALQEELVKDLVNMAVASTAAGSGRETVLSLLGVGSAINTSA